MKTERPMWAPGWNSKMMAILSFTVPPMSLFGSASQRMITSEYVSAARMRFPARSCNRVAAGLVVVAVVWGGSTNLAAQQQVRSVEVAIGAGRTRFGSIDPETVSDEEQRRRTMPVDVWSESFIALRLGYNLSRRLALEAEVLTLPKYRQGPAVNGDVAFRGRGKMQVSAGVKAGWRGRAVGVFGKGRIGVIRFGRFPSIIEISDTPNTQIVVTADNEGATWPLLEAGVVVEGYLSKRLLVRADIGDAVVWYRPSPRELNPEYSRHNVNGAISVGIRF